MDLSMVSDIVLGQVDRHQANIYSNFGLCLSLFYHLCELLPIETIIEHVFTMYSTFLFWK